MSIVTKVAKMRLNYHATMLDICNVANQLGILKDEKAEEVMKKHTFKCFDAMEHMGLDPYGAMKERALVRTLLFRVENNFSNGKITNFKGGITL